MNKITSDDLIKAIENMALIDMPDIVKDYCPDWTEESKITNTDHVTIYEFDGGSKAPFLRARVIEVPGMGGNTLIVKLGVKASWRIPKHHHKAMKALEHYDSGNSPWDRDDVIDLLRPVPHEMIYTIGEYNSMADEKPNQEWEQWDTTCEVTINLYPVDHDTYLRPVDCVGYHYAKILPKNADGSEAELVSESAFQITGKTIKELRAELDQLGFIYGGFDDTEHVDSCNSYTLNALRATLSPFSPPW